MDRLADHLDEAAGAPSLQMAASVRHGGGEEVIRFLSPRGGKGPSDQEVPSWGREDLNLRPTDSEFPARARRTLNSPLGCVEESLRSGPCEHAGIVERRKRRRGVEKSLRNRGGHVEAAVMRLAPTSAGRPTPSPPESRCSYAVAFASPPRSGIERMMVMRSRRRCVASTQSRTQPSPAHVGASIVLPPRPGDRVRRPHLDKCTDRVVSPFVRFAPGAPEQAQKRG